MSHPFYEFELVVPVVVLIAHTFTMYSGCKIYLTVCLNVLNNYETNHFR